MAITIDPASRIIQLDSFTVSVLSDNLKYGVSLTQIGGFAPVALYIFLQGGWRVRPLEANGITTITGNLLVEGGGSPIAPTLGNFNTLVNMETPVLAAVIEVNVPVLTPTQGAQITSIETATTELHKIRGLSLGNPVTMTPTSIEADDIDLTISGNGTTTSTITRNA